MLDFSIQARSNLIDIFGTFVGEGNPTPIRATLRAKPVEFEIGNRTTDPELAMLTLSVKEARDLANRVLRAAGKEGS